MVFNGDMDEYMETKYVHEWHGEFDADIKPPHGEFDADIKPPQFSVDGFKDEVSFVMENDGVEEGVDPLQVWAPPPELEDAKQESVDDMRHEMSDGHSVKPEDCAGVGRMLPSTLYDYQGLLTLYEDLKKDFEELNRNYNAKVMEAERLKEELRSSFLLRPNELASMEEIVTRLRCTIAPQCSQVCVTPTVASAPCSGNLGTVGLGLAESSRPLSDTAPVTTSVTAAPHIGTMGAASLDLAETSRPVSGTSPFGNVGAISLDLAESSRPLSSTSPVGTVGAISLNLAESSRLVSGTSPVTTSVAAPHIGTMGTVSLDLAETSRLMPCTTPVTTSVTTTPHIGTMGVIGHMHDRCELAPGSNIFITNSEKRRITVASRGNPLEMTRMLLRSLFSREELAKRSTGNHRIPVQTRRAIQVFVNSAKRADRLFLTDKMLTKVINSTCGVTRRPLSASFGNRHGRLGTGRATPHAPPNACTGGEPERSQEDEPSDWHCAYSIPMPDRYELPPDGGISITREESSYIVMESGGEPRKMARLMLRHFFPGQQLAQLSAKGKLRNNGIPVNMRHGIHAFVNANKRTDAPNLTDGMLTKVINNMCSLKRRVLSGSFRKHSRDGMEAPRVPLPPTRGWQEADATTAVTRLAPLRNRLDLARVSYIPLMNEQKSFVMLESDGKPRKMARLLLRILFSGDELAELSAKGRLKNNGVPTKMRHEIQVFVNRNKRGDEPFLTDKLLTKIINETCSLKRRVKAGSFRQLQKRHSEEGSLHTPSNPSTTNRPHNVAAMHISSETTAADVASEPTTGRSRENGSPGEMSRNIVPQHRAAPTNMFQWSKVVPLSQVGQQNVVPWPQEGQQNMFQWS